jgi:hypothetical protein
VWPSETADHKKLRQSSIHLLFNTYSWKAVESSRVDVLEEAVIVLRLFVEALAASEHPPADHDSLVELLKVTRDLHRNGQRAPEPVHEPAPESAAEPEPAGVF